MKIRRFKTGETWLLSLLVICGLSYRQTTGAEPVDIAVVQHGFAGTYYDATSDDKQVGVIMLGGSEGGKPKQHAQAFAAEGYSVLSLAYFKAPGLPKYLDEIPLEYFDKPIAWFAARPSMRGRKIVVVGGSKGGELALLLASRKKEIGGVISVSGGSVVFQGIPKNFFPPRSSWSFKGESIPFVPYDISKGIDMKNFRPMYEQSLTHEKKVEKATIPVENINGPVLLLTGKEDGMWPASELSEAVVRRLKKNEFPHTFQHVSYDDAGHTLSEFMMMGGTKEGNKKARLDSWTRILKFLAAVGNNDSTKK